MCIPGPTTRWSRTLHEVKGEGKIQGQYSLQQMGSEDAPGKFFPLEHKKVRARNQFPPSSEGRRLANGNSTHY